MKTLASKIDDEISTAPPFSLPKELTSPITNSKALKIKTTTISLFIL